MDYFDTDTILLTSASPGSYLLGWTSRISDRCFYYRDGDNPSTQRIACELDNDSIKSLSFRKGVYSTDLEWWKFYPNRYTGRVATPIGRYLNTTGFTIQMTCTYEEFTNWCAIMGMCQSYYPVGLSLGQYDNGKVGWGFYPVTVGTLQNQHVRVSIPTSSMPIGKFNWCFVYKENKLYLYINGLLMDSTTMPAGWTWTTSTGVGALGISLGYNYQGGSRHFKGSIYSLLMYNEALTDIEVYNNYMVDKGKYLITG